MSLSVVKKVNRGRIGNLYIRGDTYLTQLKKYPYIPCAVRVSNHATIEWE